MKNMLFQKKSFVFFAALFCCFLWGSAFPGIKTGYKLLHIASSATFSQILFAGMRFFLAGILVLFCACVFGHKKLTISKKDCFKIVVLAFFQTFGQYLFFYIALSHCEGSRGAVINTSGIFFAVFLAPLFIKSEKLDLKSVIGCVVGFLGVVLIHLNGDLLQSHFVLAGEGAMLIAAFCNAFAAVFIRKFSQDSDPFVLCGYQFVLGGAALSLVGLGFGGHIETFSTGGSLILIYLAFVSAGAYSVWSFLLKYNTVSVISIFNFMTPVVGVILSGIFLGENITGIKLIIALILSVIGIIIVNNKSSKKACSEDH